MMSMNNVYKLHAWFIKIGRDNHPTSLGRLLLGCTATSSPESLTYSRSLFSHFPFPDTFAYNTIIRAHAAAPSSCCHALSFFTQMRHQGVPPDNFTFPFLLKACARLQQGQDLHAHILKLGFDSDIYVQNALVSLYGGCGSVELAMNVFHAMRERDLVSWSSMMSCFINNGFAYEALALFQQMQLAENLMPDEVTMLSVISAVSSLGEVELGQWVHKFIYRSGLELTVPLVKLHDRGFSLHHLNASQHMQFPDATIRDALIQLGIIVSLTDDLAAGINLTVHCKSGDRDLGVHVVPYHGFHEFIVHRRFEGGHCFQRKRMDSKYAS
ncbi:hypothetical protein DVH24_022225 [Malus domestica]|uniref:DYW domain-containing protein n=1 Tax=Malus domestica TaxID=3750 RepID=A0A498IYZ1_MALDO|nr:hypothetical protein DVH24_022225 [Malus domestica]